jgi:phage anti-repressor protein
MSIVRAITCIVLLIGSFDLQAQKVKYKDLYELLSTRQFETAEPILKRYLAETTDNPNAFLYMGFILQEKSLKDDILRNTQEAVWHMDSAVINFTKAYSMINDKELKRNKDYYAIYNKRDIRTGEYGVKLTDIQFEIEKYNESLRERIDKVNMIKHYFVEADKLYKKSSELFLTIQETFPEERLLYLRANESVLKDLERLSSRFDSCAKAIDHYKIALSNLPKSGYNQSWNLTEIKDMKKDGREVADFYAASVLIWDYKGFADHALSIIKKEIIPNREQLIRHDMTINSLEEKLLKDSVSVANELTRILDKGLIERLKKFDPDPMPVHVLNVKIAKLGYQSVIIENRKTKDTTDLTVMMELLRREVAAARKLDTVAQKLAAKNIEQDALNYTEFVSSTYSSASILRNFARAQKDYAAREIKRKDNRLFRMENALNWLVVDNDSIPISSALSNPTFKSLVIVDQRYTAGLSYADPENVRGYFYTITPSRKPDIKVKFDIDHELFNQNITTLKGLAASDSGNNIYFVLIVNESPVSEKYQVTVAKLYRSDGLSWSYSYALDFIPEQIVYVQETAELAIKADAEQMVILDKGGKLK